MEERAGYFFPLRYLLSVDARAALLHRSLKALVNERYKTAVDYNGHIDATKTWTGR